MSVTVETMLFKLVVSIVFSLLLVDCLAVNKAIQDEIYSNKDNAVGGLKDGSERAERARLYIHYTVQSLIISGSNVVANAQEVITNTTIDTNNKAIAGNTPQSVFDCIASKNASSSTKLAERFDRFPTNLNSEQAKTNETLRVTEQKLQVLESSVDSLYDQDAADADNCDEEESCVAKIINNSLTQTESIRRSIQTDIEDVQNSRSTFITNTYKLLARLTTDIEKLRDDGVDNIVDCL